MAYRGRGGYGRGGFGRGYAKEEPFVLFPDANLPDASGALSSISDKIKNSREEMFLVRESLVWLDKPTEYYLEQTAGKDKRRKGNREINSFSQYLVPSMFPRELTTGSNVREVRRDKVVWDRKKDETLFDRFEKMEQESAAKEKIKAEKGEDEDEDHGDEEVDEDEDEDSDNDYNEHMRIDDDEDAYNDEEEGDEEPELEM